MDVKFIIEVMAEREAGGYEIDPFVICLCTLGRNGC